MANVLLLIGALLAASAVCAQDFAVDSFTLDSGWGTSTGSGFVVSGSITPPATDPMSGGGFAVTGEFVDLLAAVPPPVEPETIFDNSGGSANGFSTGNPANTFANRFCPGSQAFALDSVTLLLNTRNPANRPVVRLQIYFADPVTGGPAASAGVMMGLSGATNPITFKLVASSYQTPITWTNATPFILAANQCYWAVLSVDVGEVLYAVSYATPTGAAAAFGRSQSHDGGVTWEPFVDSDNRKMVVRGTAVPATSPIPQLVAGTATAIPGGAGHFISLPGGPNLSGNSLIFYGTGSGGQQGIYVSTVRSLRPPSRIADLTTPIPDGTGSFTSFGSEAGIIIVSGKNAVFAGTGAGGQRGIYAAVMDPPRVGVPFRIADGTTAIPGGSGGFTEFPGEPGVNGNSVVFAGAGAGGQRGILAAVMVPPQVGAPFRIADTTTAIPGGTGNFTELDGPGVSDNTAVFAGSGAGGQRGVYAAVMVPPQVGVPVKIADTATPIPGGTGNFKSLGSEAGIIIVSGKGVVFGGTGAGGQRGIYGAKLVATAASAPALHAGAGPQEVGRMGGTLASPLFRIADTATAIPGGAGNFTDFGEASVSETGVAFLGHGTGGQTGIYGLTDGQLRKVIAVGEAINGKTIIALAFSRGGLFGGSIAFQATLSDGSQGVYSVDVIEPAFELHLTGVERDGNELRLRFTSLTGTNYVIQRRADVAAGEWLIVPGSMKVGTGATLELSLPLPTDRSQQFYRVRQLP